MLWTLILREEINNCGDEKIFFFSGDKGKSFNGGQKVRKMNRCGHKPKRCEKISPHTHTPQRLPLFISYLKVIILSLRWMEERTFSSCEKLEPTR